MVKSTSKTGAGIEVEIEIGENQVNKKQERRNRIWAEAWEEKGVGVSQEKRLQE